MDLERHELTRRGVPVPLRRQLADLLEYFVSNRGRVVSKEELRAHVWSNVSVSDEALTSALRDLRRALGDCESPHRMLVTIRTRGYRLAAPASSEEEAAFSSSLTETQSIGILRAVTRMPALRIFWV